MSVTFNDIRAMIAQRSAFPVLDGTDFDKIMRKFQERDIGFSDEEENALRRLAKIQGRAWPFLHHPRAAFYASAYASGKEATQHKISEIAGGSHPVTTLCAVNNADLRVYELDLETPPPSHGFGEAVLAHAISYGLMAVEDKVDCLILASLSAGVQDAMTQIATAISQGSEALDALALYAGHDLGAMIGAALAARMARIPVLCGPQTEAFLRPVLASLLQGEEIVLSLASDRVRVPEDLAGLRTCHALRGLIALGPAPARNLTQIAAVV